MTQFTVKISNMAVGDWRSSKVWAIPTTVPHKSLATFNAFLPLAKVLQCFLIVPIELTSKAPPCIHPFDDKAEPTRGNCKFISLHVLLSTCTFVVLPVSTWYVITSYSARLKNPLEKYFTTFYLLLETFCVITICFWAIIPSRGTAFRHLFGSWRALDRSLGILEDLELELCARQLLRRWIATNVIGVLMVLALGVFKIIDIKLNERAREVSSPLIIGPLAVCVLYLTAALCGTEVFLYFQCKAVLLRMSCIRQRVALIVKQSNVGMKVETASSLEFCRLTLEALRSIGSQTLELLAPLLLGSTIASGSTLAGAVVGLLHQESGNTVFTMLKTCLGLFAFCNVLFLVRAATLQNKEAKELFCTLQSASTVFMDRPSQFQLYLMMASVKYCPLEFTACGFFSLNYRFLHAMIGITLTCLLTAVDFDNDLMHESHGFGTWNCTN